MQDYGTLYKIDNHGKTRQWKMLRDEDKYCSVSGVKNGKQTKSKWTTATPKNVGRSNATTGEEQADKEVQAKYTKKRDEGGYAANLSVSGPCYVQPMLAQTYGKAKIEFPILSQPKLDGIRAICKRADDGSVGLWTRRGKPITSCPHITEQLKPLLNQQPELILDGELYNHSLRDQFQKIVSLVRRQKLSDQDRLETAKLVEYHVYDLVGPDVPFMDRCNDLYDLENKFGPSIKIVAADLALHGDDLDRFHSQCMQQGYEGSILRQVGGLYEVGKRSKGLLKRKDFDTAEFPLVEVLEGKGNRSDMAGRIQFDGFRAGIRGGVELYKQLWADRKHLVGTDVTVRYFGLTDDGIPRHPVAIDFHYGGRSD